MPYTEHSLLKLAKDDFARLDLNDQVIFDVLKSVKNDILKFRQSLLNTGQNLGKRKCYA